MSPHGGGRLRVGRDPTSTRVTAAVVESWRVRLARPSEGSGKGGSGVVPGQRVAVDPSQVQAARHVRRSAEAVTAASSCRCVRTRKGSEEERRCPPERRALPEPDPQPIAPPSEPREAQEPRLESLSPSEPKRRSKVPCRDSDNASGVASRYHPCGSVSLPRETQEPRELQEPRCERDCTNWSAVGA
eukprot:scaffold43364_cov108-Phaeocystis_antarctica.AAC.3